MSRLILVTGGAGFIGSHLVDALLARGDRVRVLDDFSTGRRENLAHCLADIELLEGDVRDLGLVGRAVAGCDGVLHEAAVASVARSIDDPVGTGSVTHGGTVNVVQQARRAGVGGFVLASSCAVYGDTDVLPISEGAKPRPLSPYALAKLLSEGACGTSAFRPGEGLPVALRGSAADATRSEVGDAARSDAAHSMGSEAGDGMRSAALRYFNVYGPRQDPSSEYSGVIARFMDVAAARRTSGESDAPTYVVYGDGRQSRDFVFVADVVAANLLALDACLSDDRGRRDEVDGAVVNVGTGVRVDLLEIVRVAEELRGGEVEAPIDFRAPREGDIRASQADISRARRLLGYEPTTCFAVGLAETFAWYARQGSAT